jgi:pullulanase
VTARRDGILQDATSVQSHGAVDDLFGNYDGPLGAQIHGGGVALRVWAPTAKSMTLHLFDQPHGGDAVAVLAMSEDARSGVWTAEGGPDWNGKYYQYAVEVYHPWGGGAPPSGAGNVVTSYATDPYSRSLAADGERTHICDVANAPELKPPGWDYLRKPTSSLEPTVGLCTLNQVDP